MGQGFKPRPRGISKFVKNIQQYFLLNKQPFLVVLCFHINLGLALNLISVSGAGTYAMSRDVFRPILIRSERERGSQKTGTNARPIDGVGHSKI